MLGQKVEQRLDLIGCGIPCQRLQVKALNALGGFDSGFRKQSPGPCGRLAVDEGIVHQCQGLSRNIGLITPAYRGVWDGQVEGNHQRREEISAGLLIDGTASISIQRTIGIADPHAVSHEGSDVSEHWWPELGVVQIACSGQERVAQSLRFQTAEVLPVEQPVRRIPALRQGIPWFARLGEGLGQAQRADQTLERTAVAPESEGEIVEQFRMRRPGAQAAEIVHRLHQATSEQMGPHAVHDHSMEEGVAGRGDRLCPFQASAALRDRQGFWA